MMELTLAMFEPRSMQLGMVGGSGSLCREQIVSVISLSSRYNELGWQAMRAEHSNDSHAISYLEQYLRSALVAHTSQCATLPDMALSAYLQRPIGSQIKALINSHPLWERERRRAAKVNVLIGNAILKGNDHEARRLESLKVEILSAARERCKREIMETGRCPRCLGSGKMLRKDAVCPSCNGTGRIIPDMQVIEKLSNSDAVRAVHNALDTISSASSKFARDMSRRLQAERDAFDC